MADDYKPALSLNAVLSAVSPAVKDSLPVPEKDCRTCSSYLETERRTHCLNNENRSNQPCILGSRYERAEFKPLWRTE